MLKKMKEGGKCHSVNTYLPATAQYCHINRFWIRGFAYYRVRQPYPYFIREELATQGGEVNGLRTTPAKGQCFDLNQIFTFKRELQVWMRIYQPQTLLSGTRDWFIQPVVSGCLLRVDQGCGKMANSGFGKHVKPRENLIVLTSLQSPPTLEAVTNNEINCFHFSTIRGLYRPLH